MAADNAKLQQPTVDKVKQLLYRKLKVLLTSGRVIEGDFACLDKLGNLILSNASEHIHAASSSSGGQPGSGSNNQSKPLLNTLGMVLIPKAQQQDVLLEVTLSEKMNLLHFAGGS